MVCNTHIYLLSRSRGTCGIGLSSVLLENRFNAENLLFHPFDSCSKGIVTLADLIRLTLSRSCDVSEDLRFSVHSFNPIGHLLNLVLQGDIESTLLRNLPRLPVGPGLQDPDIFQDKLMVRIRIEQARSNIVPRLRCEIVRVVVKDNPPLLHRVDSTARKARATLFISFYPRPAKAADQVIATC